jgi:hypothetical protein
MTLIPMVRSSVFLSFCRGLLRLSLRVSFLVAVSLKSTEVPRLCVFGDLAASLPATCCSRMYSSGSIFGGRRRRGGAAAVTSLNSWMDIQPPKAESARRGGADRVCASVPVHLLAKRVMVVALMSLRYVLRSALKVLTHANEQKVPVTSKVSRCGS